jgi:Cys-tRNA(Pro)/Cys-tRNA(Cys) deacylase
MKTDKTNAMRILDKEKVDYQMLTYSSDDGKIDGISVANKIGKDIKMVYKTLITQGTSKSYYVFVIPVDTELDLKKAAKSVGEKKVEMIAVKDIMKVSGYIRGGCSPIGMKKLYPTYIDQSAQLLDAIIVSGGKIGVQIEMGVEDLVKVVKAHLVELTKA